MNALLTQLDKLKHRKNVLVMSTSNLAKAIGACLYTPRCSWWFLIIPHTIGLRLCTADSAFVDRADIVQYIDLPPREAIYEILRTCLSELIVKGIVVGVVSVYTFDLYSPTR